MHSSHLQIRHCLLILRKLHLGLSTRSRWQFSHLSKAWGMTDFTGESKLDSQRWHGTATYKLHQKPGEYFWSSEFRPHAWKQTFVKPRTNSFTQQFLQYLAFICHTVIILLIQINPYLTRSTHSVNRTIRGAKRRACFRNLSCRESRHSVSWQQERKTISRCVYELRCMIVSKKYDKL